MAGRLSKAFVYTLSSVAGSWAVHGPVWLRVPPLFVSLRVEECSQLVQYMHTGWKGSSWSDSWLKPDKKDAELASLTSSTVLTSNATSAATVLRLSKMCEEGMLEEALRALDILGLQDVRVSSHILTRVLQMALAKKDLATGKRVHFHIVSHGLCSNKILGNLLIRFFSVCGDLEEARKAFYQISKPDVDTWRAIIKAHSKQLQGQHAFRLYQEMLQSGQDPDAHVYVAVLRACANMAAIDHGKMVHARVTATGHQHNLFVNSALMDMYLKCGSLEDACQVFRNLSKRDLVSCNTMLAGYVDYGRGPDAVCLFADMLQEGLQPDNATFRSVVKACSQIASLDEAKVIITQLMELGMTLNPLTVNGLIDMYLKCGSVDDARHVFDEAARKDVVAWNAMVAGYAQHGCVQQAFQLVDTAGDEGFELRTDTIVTILRACCNLEDFEKGKALWAEFINRGLETDSKVDAAFMEMCQRCGVDVPR